LSSTLVTTESPLQNAKG
jgi:hypothetical protein